MLGCGGVIALKAQAGSRVQVIVMTDGRASHKALINPDELVRIRRAEANEAAAQLGLDASFLFLDYEDQRLADHHDAARDRAAEIIDRFKPDEIYIPSRREGISDHTETNHVVREAVGRIGKPVVLLEYPIWLWSGWPWIQKSLRRSPGFLRARLRVARDIAEIVIACRTRVDVSDVLHRKRAALAAYRSQIERLNGDPRWPVLADVGDPEFLRYFEREVEIFRRSDYRPRRPAEKRARAPN